MDSSLKPLGKKQQHDNLLGVIHVILDMKHN